MPTVIPSGPQDVTSSWLAGVLGVGIDSVAVTPVGTGQTGATYRVTPTYSAQPTGLPDTFIVKLPCQEEAVRQRVAGGYLSEYAFYTEVAHTVSVPLAQCYHCEIDRDGADFVLLMSDLAPAIQGDQIIGCTLAEARLAVTALAGLHGPRWCDPAWLTFSGAMMPKLDADAAQGIGDLAIMAAQATVDKLGERMTASRPRDPRRCCVVGQCLGAASARSVQCPAWRLPHRQPDVRSPGHPCHRRGLANPVNRPPGARSRLLCGHQPGAGVACPIRAHAGQRLS